jgi:hypothetical protein
MEDNSESAGKAPARVIRASRYRDGLPAGKTEIIASTKHGTTAMLSVMPPEKLEIGETLVTDAFILGTRNFVVLAEHKKPMKLPGTWYEVRATMTTMKAKAKK